MMKKTKTIYYIILLMFFIAAIPQTLHAFSLQARGEYGQLFGGEEKYFNDGDNFYKFGLDLFLYEGRRVHFSLGFEHLEYKTKKLAYQTPGYTEEPEIEYTAHINGVSGGVKVYINPKYKLKPYVLFGILYAKATYDDRPSRQDYDYNLSMKNHQILAGKTGLGIETGFTKNLTVGIELNFTGPVSQADVNLTSSGAINFGEPDKDIGDLYLIGFGTTIRYHF
jgi:hypothetical protein